MSRLMAGWDRFFTFLLALVFAFFGVWAILFYLDNPYAKKLAGYRSPEGWKNAYFVRELPWVLIAVLIVFLILGLWLILANLRRKRVTQVYSESSSNELGDIHFNISDIGGAVASQLGTIPGVNSVKKLVALDRGRPTMQFTLNAEADADIDTIRSAIDHAERDIRESIADADIDTIYRIHLDKVEHS